MIVFCLFKLLNWLYCWGEITTNSKQLLTAFSAIECFFEIFGIIGFCAIELPNILAKIKFKR